MALLASFFLPSQLSLTRCMSVLWLQYFAGGAGAESDIAKHLEKVTSIIRLGYNFTSPSLRTRIDRYIMRNTDLSESMHASYTSLYTQVLCEHAGCTCMYIYTYFFNMCMFAIVITYMYNTHICTCMYIHTFFYVFLYVCMLYLLCLYTVYLYIH